MWELDHKEGWVPKNWYFWTAVLEKTPESPLDCKETKPVHPKRNQSWIFIERLMLKLKLQYFAKNWLIRKDPEARKNWRQEEKGMTEDEMVGWHHQINGHEFEQGPGVGDGQGSLVCCSPWGCRVGHDWVTELNWTEMFLMTTLYIEVWFQYTKRLQKQPLVAICSASYMLTI